MPASIRLVLFSVSNTDLAHYRKFRQVYFPLESKLAYSCSENEPISAKLVVRGECESKFG